MNGMNHHKLTSRLPALGQRNVNWFIRAEFLIIAQIFPQVCSSWTQLVQHGDSGKLEVSPLALKSLGLSLRGFAFVYKRNQTILVAKFSFALRSCYNTKCFSFTAGGEASSVALRWHFQRNYISSTAWQPMLAPHGALALLSLDERVWTMWAPHGALALTSLDKQAWALVLLRTTPHISTSLLEDAWLALSKDNQTDPFLTWREAKLAPTGTVASSDRVKLALLEKTVVGPCMTLVSHETCWALYKAKVGSRGVILISTEIDFCFQALVRGTLAREIFRCLRMLIGLESPSGKSWSNVSWSNWMTKVSAVDLKVWSCFPLIWKWENL